MVCGCDLWTLECTIGVQGIEFLPQESLTSHERTVSFLSNSLRNSTQVSEDYFPMSPQWSSCNSQRLHRDTEVTISQAAHAHLSEYAGLYLCLCVCTLMVHCFSPSQQSASPALFFSFVTIVTLSDAIHMLTQTHMQKYTGTHTPSHAQWTSLELQGCVLKNYNERGSNSNINHWSRALTVCH